MDNQEFLQVVTDSFHKFLTTGSRSNEKLKILHGAIASDLKTRLCDTNYSVSSLGIGDGKEKKIDGRYIEKTVDITVSHLGNPIAGIGVKFVMQNYSQNSNNYFENMLGETANIRCSNIPYFQIFIIPDKLPYYDNGGTLKRWEEFSQHNSEKYLTLSKDNIETSVHTPTKTLLFVIHLPDITNDIRTKTDYEKYYRCQSNLIIKESSLCYGCFSGAVIYNNYEEFITKVVHYIQFI